MVEWKPAQAWSEYLVYLPTTPLSWHIASTQPGNDKAYWFGKEWFSSINDYATCLGYNLKILPSDDRLAFERELVKHNPIFFFGYGHGYYLGFFGERVNEDLVLLLQGFCYCPIPGEYYANRCIEYWDREGLPPTIRYWWNSALMYGRASYFLSCLLGDYCCLLEDLAYCKKGCTVGYEGAYSFAHLDVSSIDDVASKERYHFPHKHIQNIIVNGILAGKKYEQVVDEAWDLFTKWYNWVCGIDDPLSSEVAECLWDDRVFLDKWIGQEITLTPPIKYPFHPTDVFLWGTRGYTDLILDGGYSILELPLIFTCLRDRCDLRNATYEISDAKGIISTGTFDQNYGGWITWTKTILVPPKDGADPWILTIKASPATGDTTHKPATRSAIFRVHPWLPKEKNIIVNGDFETGNLSGWYYSAPVPGKFNLLTNGGFEEGLRFWAIGPNVATVSDGYEGQRYALLQVARPDYPQDRIGQSFTLNTTEYDIIFAFGFKENFYNSFRVLQHPFLQENVAELSFTIVKSTAGVTLKDDITGKTYSLPSNIASGWHKFELNRTAATYTVKIDDVKYIYEEIPAPPLTPETKEKTLRFITEIGETDRGYNMLDAVGVWVQGMVPTPVPYISEGVYGYNVAFDVTRYTVPGWIEQKLATTVQAPSRFCIKIHPCLPVIGQTIPITVKLSGPEPAQLLLNFHQEGVVEFYFNESKIGESLFTGWNRLVLDITETETNIIFNWKVIGTVNKTITADSIRVEVGPAGDIANPAGVILDDINYGNL